FLARLQEKNPVTAYRFARGLDPDFRHLAGGRFWPKAEREKALATHTRDEDKPAGHELTRDHWLSWLTPLADETVPRGWCKDGAGTKGFLPQVAANRDLLDVKVRFFDGTAVGESLLEVIKQERNQMVQGIVIFTDGRSTEGSLQAVRDAAALA